MRVLELYHTLLMHKGEWYFWEQLMWNVWLRYLTSDPLHLCSSKAWDLQKTQQSGQISFARWVLQRTKINFPLRNTIVPNRSITWLYLAFFFAFSPQGKSSWLCTTCQSCSMRTQMWHFCVCSARGLYCMKSPTLTYSVENTLHYFL